MKVVKLKKLEGRGEYTLQPSNVQLATDLVNETLLIGADALAKQHR